jgi:hypothetical protein
MVDRWAQPTSIEQIGELAELHKKTAEDAGRLFEGSEIFDGLHNSGDGFKETLIAELVAGGVKRQRAGEFVGMIEQRADLASQSFWEAYDQLGRLAGTVQRLLAVRRDASLPPTMTIN